MLARARAWWGHVSSLVSVFCLWNVTMKAKKKGKSSIFILKSCYKYGVVVSAFLKCNAFLYFLLCYKLQECNKFKEFYINVLNSCSNWDLFLLIHFCWASFWWPNLKPQILCSFFINFLYLIYIIYFNISVKYIHYGFYVYFIYSAFNIKKSSILENMSFQYCQNTSPLFYVYLSRLLKR